MIDRFSRPRAARNAEHKVIYRNDAEFAGWPHISGFWETAKGHLVQHFMRTAANYSDASKISHDNLAGGSVPLGMCSIRSEDRGRSWSKPVLVDRDANVSPVPDGTPDPITELGGIDFLD
jgi:hypothetical protein